MNSIIDGEKLINVLQIAKEFCETITLEYTTKGVYGYGFDQHFCVSVSFFIPDCEFKEYHCSRQFIQQINTNDLYMIVSSVHSGNRLVIQSINETDSLLLNVIIVHSSFFTVKSTLKSCTSISQYPPELGILKGFHIEMSSLVFEEAINSLSFMNKDMSFFDRFYEIVCSSTGVFTIKNKNSIVDLGGVDNSSICFIDGPFPMLDNGEENNKDKFSRGNYLVEWIEGITQGSKIDNIVTILVGDSGIMEFSYSIGKSGKICVRVPKARGF